MQFELDASQREFQQSLRKFLADKASEEKLRSVVDSGAPYDPDLWSAMARQLGLQSVAIPERFGGAGATAVELGIIMRELGYAMTSVPFLSSSVLASSVLLASGDEDAMATHLPALASGELVATLVWRQGVEPGIAATQAPDGSWSLEGDEPAVLDGVAADLMLVLASAGAGPTWFVVERTAGGIVVEGRSRTLDPTRRLAAVALRGVAARPLGEFGDGSRIRTEVLGLARVALASEQVGVAIRATEMAVEYAKIRHQFGRPIASFQAVKHLCADMRVHVEAAEAAADFGLVTASNDPQRLPRVAPMIASYCSDAAVAVTKSGVQVLGGLGFTWEHAMHFYLKRAKANSILLGSSVRLREEVMTEAAR